jgi:dipeptidase E
MKKILLSSSFKDVASLLAPFVQDSLAGKTVTFIPTASIPETVTFYVAAAKKAFKKMELQVEELDIRQVPYAEIAATIAKNDYIYLTGGNTFYLLQELKKSGADQIIREQVRLGKPYIGESAGAAIAAPTIEYMKEMDDPTAAPHLTSFKGLELVDFCPVPHYNNAPFKKITKNIVQAYQQKLDLKPISNHQAIQVLDQEIEQKEI